jgi:chaperonin GroEL (HSP60 family)
MAVQDKLFGDGASRISGGQSRRHNLFVAKLVAELVKNSLGPRGLQKIFIDILGEVTVTKDGAALLRKIDVEHPAAKVIIEASNAVDNEVGDGTTSVVILAGALAQKAEELLDLGISPTTILDGYTKSLEVSLEILRSIANESENSDRRIMENLAATCLRSKPIGLAGDQENMVAKFVVDAICSIADFKEGRIDTDDIKIEEKPGNMSDTQLVRGIVIDKTIDSSAMPRMVENARIILIDDDLEGKRTRTDAEIHIVNPNQISTFTDAEKSMIRSKVQHIIESGANVVISRKGINTFAQHLLSEAGIISVRRVKENDLLWLAKATGATIADRLDHEHEDHHEHHGHSHHHDELYHYYHHSDIDIKLGYAARVYEKFVGDDKMVFVEGCKDPKSVTLLLRAGTKTSLDECHRSVLDALYVLRDFIIKPSIVAGGGSTELIIATEIKQRSLLIGDREQMVLTKFAEALEEIPLTIARNSGMNVIDTLVELRKRSSYGRSNGSIQWYGVDAIDRKIDDMFSRNVIEPCIVKEQIFKTAVEVIGLLLRVDDVLVAKPTMSTHTHANGTTHSHENGNKKHEHFDRIGKEQRPMHHYY